MNKNTQSAEIAERKRHYSCVSTYYVGTIREAKHAYSLIDLLVCKKDSELMLMNMQHVSTVHK